MIIETDAHHLYLIPVLKWLEGKQVNAILSILSVLVGVVFSCLQLVFFTSVYLQI